MGNAMIQASVETGSPPPFDLDCDTLIIGAGACGLVAAPLKRQVESQTVVDVGDDHGVLFVALGALYMN